MTNTSPASDAAGLPDIRCYFAEEIRVVCNLRSEALVEALAAVPREQFVGPGPWMIRGSDFDLQGALAVPTRDGDARNVYHNVSIAIDPARQLFNGQPATLASWIDKLELKGGDRVLHIGCATGYYTAIIAHVVGPAGRVTAVEIDDDLARRAKDNLASMNWVEVRAGDGTSHLPESFDAILINAGVTHPLRAWVDAMADGGRMALPLTVTTPGMAPTLGKGCVLIVTRKGDAYDARFFSAVVIYSCVGIRDEAMNQRLTEGLRKGNFLQVRHLLRTAHEPAAGCWLHGSDLCLTLD